MERWTKKYYFIFSFLEILLFLFMAISIAGEDKHTFYINSRDIFADSSEGRLYGVELSQESSELYSSLQTEKLQLEKGIYDITVTYTATDGGTLNVIADGESPTGMWADNIQLPNTDTERKFSIWANDPLEQVHIQVASNGGALSVQGILIKTADNSGLYRIICVLLKFGLVNLLVAVYYFRERLRKYSIEIVGVLGITLIASVAMLTRYTLPGHDLVFHLLRIEGIKDGLLSGAFPVRIQPNWCNGWGYAVSIMYGDTTLLLPAIMRILGFTVQTTYKTFVISVNFFTALIAFYSFHKICKNKYYALLGSLLFTTAPYRLVDIYIRGAFGEYTAMMFLPLIALGFWYAFEEDVENADYGKKLIAPVIGFSGLIQTHVLTCQMAAIFIVLLCLIAIKKVLRKKTFLYLFKIVGLTVLVNLWFIIPFLRYFSEDLNGNDFKEMALDFQMLGVSITELIAPEASGYWGWSWSELTSIARKFSIPFSNALLLCAVFGLLCIWNDKLKEKRTASVALVLGSLAVWMGTNLFPYHFIQTYLPKIATFLAKPALTYRYLSLACILLSLFLVILFQRLDVGKIRASVIGIAYFVIALTGITQSLAFSYDTLYSGYWDLRYDGSILDTTNLIGYEYLYRGTDVGITNIEKNSVGQNVAISGSQKRYNHIEVDCTVIGEDAYLEAPLFYYPGYTAYTPEDSGRREFEVERGSNNRIKVMLPQGFSGRVIITFKEPIIWRIAEFVSALTVMLLIIKYIWPQKKKLRSKISQIKSSIKDTRDMSLSVVEKIFGFRVLRALFILLAISVLTEICLFNYRHWETVGNKPYEVKSISYGSGYLDNYDGTYTVGEGGLELEIADINDILSNAYINIEIVNKPEDEVRSIRLSQQVTDYSHRSYYGLPSRDICDQENRSKYMTYHLYGECRNLLITPTLQLGEVVAIQIILNPVIPMFFSWERILYCFLILASIYLFRPGSELHKIKYMELTAVCKRNLIILICLIFMTVTWKMVTLIPLFQNDPWDNYKGYQHLAEALAEGSFSLLEEPSQTLINMDNPYDMNYRFDEMARTGEGFLWDHAYYNGKYYIYFGVVPVLMFHLPYYLITGHHLMNHVVIFIIGCFYLAGVLLLFHEMIRRWYRNCSVGVWFMSLALFLVGVQSFYLIKRPDIYAVPIFMASAFGVWGITFILKAQGEEKRLSSGYLMAGSLCIALIAGCRPQQFLFFGIACIMLGKYLFPISYWRSREGMKAFGALTVPMLVVAVALMYYNYARFGSPFDFGANYNLTLNDMRYRGWVWDRIPLGLMSYLFWPIRLKPDYPFIESIYLYTNYMGVTIQEPAYGGLFAIAPFFIMCGGTFIFHKELRKYNKTTWLIAVYSIVSAIIIIMADTQMAGIVMRYYTDFAPFLGLAALIVTWGVLEKAGSRVNITKAVITFMLACYLFEFVFHGLKFTVDVASSLQEQRPEVYAHFKYLTSFWL